MEDIHGPPAVEVVADGAGRDKTQSVLLAYVVEFYCDVFVHKIITGTGTLTGTY